MTNPRAKAVARLALPDTYAADRLGVKLHPKQSAVLRDLFRKRGSHVSLRCANEVGKLPTSERWRFSTLWKS